MVFGVQSSSNRIGYLPIGVHPRAARRSFQALLGFGIVIAIGSLVLVLFHTEVSAASTPLHQLPEMC
jgi:hypothetical protein